jgi:hypothetical protein
MTHKVDRTNQSILTMIFVRHDPKSICAVEQRLPHSARREIDIQSLVTADHRHILAPSGGWAAGDVRPTRHAVGMAKTYKEAPAFKRPLPAPELHKKADGNEESFNE